MDLGGLLERDRDAIVGEAVTAMHRADLRHYRESGAALSRVRLAALFDVTATSIAGRTLMPIERHAESIAHERFHSGFDLGEVQTAFNVLEEAIWKHIERDIPAPELGRALALVSTVLGAGKDHLARAYVEQATQTQVPALDMRALFRAPKE